MLKKESVRAREMINDSTDCVVGTNANLQYNIVLLCIYSIAATVGLFPLSAYARHSKHVLSTDSRDELSHKMWSLKYFFTYFLFGNVLGSWFGSPVVIPVNRRLSSNLFNFKSKQFPLSKSNYFEKRLNSKCRTSIQPTAQEELVCWNAEKTFYTSNDTFNKQKNAVHFDAVWLAYAYWFALSMWHNNTNWIKSKENIHGRKKKKMDK